MSRNIVRFGLEVVLAVSALLLVGTSVSAGGPPVYDRWVTAGTNAYRDPDRGADIGETFTQTTKIEVSFVIPGWYLIPGTAKYLEVGSLLKEEPAALRVQRDADAQKQAQEKLEATKVGDMSWGELVKLLRQLLSGTQPVAPVAATTPVSAPAAVASATSQYTVKAGDSLSGIGVQLGVDWRELAKANSISAPYVLNVGQVLVVPAAIVTAAAPVAGTAPVVSISSWPATAEQFLALATQGQPSSDGSWLPIEIGEIHRAPKEPNSWAVAREKNKNGDIIPFWINNFSGRDQDGYCLVSGKYTTGTPAGFQGLSQGVTFRP